MWSHVGRPVLTGWGTREDAERGLYPLLCTGTWGAHTLLPLKCCLGNTLPPNVLFKSGHCGTVCAQWARALPPLWSRFQHAHSLLWRGRCP